MVTPVPSIDCRSTATQSIVPTSAELTNYHGVDWSANQDRLGPLREEDFKMTGALTKCLR